MIKVVEKQSEVLLTALLCVVKSDQPGMLCSFKISTAWSCAWCLNPQADKTFSTGKCVLVYRACSNAALCVSLTHSPVPRSGLSRSVIVTDAVTGRRQTYSTGSDVLAQQFALRVSGSVLTCPEGNQVIILSFIF